MTWRAKTYHVGGGDDPFTSIRHYVYWRAGSWRDWFKRSRVKISLPFETEERGINGEARGHARVLHDHPFFINDQDVVSWVQGTARGFVSLDFVLDNSIEETFGRGEATKTLRARFSDKGTAMLFKLAFGGR